MKKHIVSLIIGIIILTVGATLAFFNIFNYQVVEENAIKLGELAWKQETIEVRPNMLYNIYITIPEFSEIKYIYNSEIENKVYIKVYYNEEIFDVSIDKKADFINGTNVKITADVTQNHFINASKLFYKAFVKTVKDKKVYNYDYLIRPVIEIEMNESEKDLIKIDIINDNDFDYHDILDYEVYE